MKKKLLLILAFTFCYLQGQSFDDKAGFVYYKHITGLTYEASIVTYTKISSPVDRNALTIAWGDGSSETVTRTNQEVVEIDLKKNTYTKRHTYTNHGVYTISMEDSTRTQGVLNINGGNSGGFPFYIESQLVIPNLGDYNNSIELLNHPILTATLGQVFSYTPAAYDKDGDILYFALATPKVNSNNAVSGYQQVTDIGPGANNQFSFDAKTGNFRWNSPQQIGLYTITLRISECRNGKMVGTTLVDYQIRVVNNLNSPLYSTINATSNDTIAPNDTIQISFGFGNTQADSIHLMAFSEGFLNGNTAVFDNDSVSMGYLGKTFQWITDSLAARCAPYIITLRGTSFLSNEKFSFDRTYLYYIRDVNTVYCDTVCNGFTKIDLIKKTPILSIQIAPNPFRTQTTIQFLDHPNGDDYTFSLFNIWGQRVRYIPLIVEDKVTINRNKLPAGVYIYKVERGANETTTGKLMVTD